MIESFTALLKQRPFAPNPLSIKIGKIERYLDDEVINYINTHTELLPESVKVFETNTRFNIELLCENHVQGIINIKRVNDIRYLNKFFETVNRKLAEDGIFIGCVETFEERAKRIFNKFPLPIAYPYYALDFILKRIFPKFKMTKKIYFLLTKGRNRVLSRAETMGRLVSCGFKIIDTKEIKNQLYFIAQKERAPYYDPNPTYGPLIKIRRVGQHGNPIYVYKFRTMHPFAEYLQGYVYHQSSLKEGGKFKNDFRITKWGTILRKFWLDELPMFLNYFKGEVKLIGVRPLSQHYLSLYKPELVQRRSKNKPGLIPPYYADMPKTLEDIMSSEERYLQHYEKHPFLTDWKYFWKAFYNIAVKRARSS